MWRALSWHRVQVLRFARDACRSYAAPPMTPERLDQLTGIALEVAEQAAAHVAQAYRKAVRASEKARSDLVTRYDVESEQLIRSRLRELTPDLPMVGEEEGGRADGPTWFCDPIDGTTNFVHGHPFFCVSLGLLDGAQPLLGAVVAPALGVRWYGAVGRGAYRDGEPCRVSDTRALSQALIATGFHPRSQGSPPHDNIGSFATILPATRGIRRCGSAAIDACMVADGTYDAYWERLLNTWDVAGGAALVLAAGGRLTDLRGAPADLSVGHVLLSNGHVHDELLALLARAEAG
jgi:myo-inositol-1(or 4)-monophosphatase